MNLQSELQKSRMQQEIVEHKLVTEKLEQELKHIQDAGEAGARVPAATGQPGVPGHAAGPAPTGRRAPVPPPLIYTTPSAPVDGVYPAQPHTPEPPAEVDETHPGGVKTLTRSYEATAGSKKSPITPSHYHPPSPQPVARGTGKVSFAPDVQTIPTQAGQPSTPPVPPPPPPPPVNGAQKPGPSTRQPAPKTEPEQRDPLRDPEPQPEGEPRMRVRGIKWPPAQPSDAKDDKDKGKHEPGKLMIREEQDQFQSAQRIKTTREARAKVEDFLKAQKGEKADKVSDNRQLRVEP